MLHPSVAALVVRALKHEATCTSANSHPTSVQGSLEIGKVRTACSACLRTRPALHACALQLAVALGFVEKSLRCSSLLDPEDLYSMAPPRQPHRSAAVTAARATEQSAQPPRLNRMHHVTMWSIKMENPVLRASNHLRTRLLELSPQGEPSVDWLGECVPNVPLSTWPGARLRTFVRACKALQAHVRACIACKRTFARARTDGRSTCGRRECMRGSTEAHTLTHTKPNAPNTRTRALSPFRSVESSLRRSAPALDSRGTRGGTGPVLACRRRRRALPPLQRWFSHLRRRTMTMQHHRCSCVAPSFGAVASPQRG